MQYASRKIHPTGTRSSHFAKTAKAPPSELGTSTSICYYNLRKEVDQERGRTGVEGGGFWQLKKKRLISFEKVNIGKTIRKEEKGMTGMAPFSPCTKGGKENNRTTPCRLGLHPGFVLLFLRPHESGKERKRLIK